jgi:hypothetical protein
VSASRIISELNQLARIASLECGSAKFPCPAEMFVSNLIAASMNFIARLPGGQLGTFGLLFCPAFFIAIAVVQKNPPARFADSPVLIWDIH